MAQIIRGFRYFVGIFIGVYFASCAVRDFKKKYPLGFGGNLMLAIRECLLLIELIFSNG